VSTTGYAHAWDTDGPVAVGSADWPMRGVDERNTGVFQITGSTGIEGGEPEPSEMRLVVLGNPAAGSAVFRLTGGTCASIDIYDLCGRRIDSVEVGADNQASWIPDSGAASGLYLATPSTTGPGGEGSVEFVLLR
jgi:hypothetical protein